MQLPLAERDREKTAFTLGDGLLHFKCMPFVLCNTSAFFQRLMGGVLGRLKWHYCLGYLDDVSVTKQNQNSSLKNSQVLNFYFNSSYGRVV